MKRKVIIDTDPGIDDAMAIMFAVNSQLFDVLAITTVCGNSTVQNTTRNARFVLQALGREDVPVYSGAEKPLKQSLTQAVVHGASGLEGIDPNLDAKLTHDAQERIISLVANNPGEVTLVTLGPLTNIAAAIQADSATMKKLKEIIIMGGAINVAGNMNRVAEFNIFVDPDAARTVFDFPVKKALVPVDACNRVQLTLRDFNEIRNRTLRDIVTRMVAPYIRNLSKDAGVGAAIMYDPSTVFYALNRSACKTYIDNVQVETQGELTRGMTVIDKRAVKDGAVPNVRIVTHISRAKFRSAFIESLSRTPTPDQTHILSLASAGSSTVAR
jgi:purine nucleosidase